MPPGRGYMRQGDCCDYQDGACYTRCVYGFIQEYYSKTSCHQRIQGAHQACRFCGGAALGDRLEGKAKARTHYCKNNYHTPLVAGLRQVRRFKYEGKNKSRAPMVPT